MTAAVDTTVLEKFTLMYGPPSTEDKPAFFAEYRKALGGVSKSILEKAVVKLVAENEFAAWPTIGRCLRAVNSVYAASAREDEFRNYRPAPDQRPARTAEQKAAINAMCEDFKARMADEIAGARAEKTEPPPAVDSKTWAARRLLQLATGTVIGASVQAHEVERVRLERYAA